MILICSACSTRYLLDPEVLASGGRQVRCTKCGHVWHQEPSDLSRIQAVSTPAEPRAAIHLQSAGREDRHFLGWAILLFFVAGVVAIGLFARPQAIAVWPPIERLYMLVGLESEVVGKGLEIRNITSEHLLEEGIKLLIIKGEVINTSKEVQEMPRLSGRLQDSRGETINEWNFMVTEARLLPGEIVTFETRIENPSFQVEALAISFIGGD